MKNLLKGLFIGFVLVLILAACGNGGDEGSSDEAEASDDEASEEKIEITFWHAMSGDNGAAIEDIVDKFNEQSDSVSVEAIFQGSYEDSLTKLRAVGGSEEAP